MTEVRIIPQAHKDIDGIYRYIIKDGENVARKQADKIYGRIERLAEMPNIGVSLDSKISKKTPYRFLIVKPWLIFYEIHESYIEIIRVLDGRQSYMEIIF